MKKSGNLIIWVIALIMLFTAAYIYYSKNKTQGLQLPFKQNTAEQSSGQQNSTGWQNTAADNKNSINQTNTKQSDENSQSGSVTQQPSDKVMAPDFELKDLKGNSAKLSDYRGKIVILNFWATWCKYCVQELPDFNELNAELEKDNDAVILAVDVQESEATVSNFLSSKKIDLKVLMDEKGEVAGTYGIEGYPTTFFINKDGSLYTYIPGATNKDTLNMILGKIRKGEPLK